MITEKPRRKRRVDETLSWDVLRLQRDGILARHNAICKSQWSQEGSEILSMGYRVEITNPEASLLQLLIISVQGKETPCDYQVPLAYTELHFGGGRWWFSLHDVPQTLPVPLFARRSQ